MQHWSDILGHKRVLGVLSRAIDAGRLHHAYLFTGPEGVGKFTLARALTATLNCERRPPAGFAPACEECSSCRRVASRQHPDVLFVEPTGASVKSIKIEQIRALQKASVSAPYEGRFRVVLINDAHHMTEEAANALLKTLEEPPARMILIVVTAQPHRLLDTIISRCQRVRFSALSTAQIIGALPALLSEDEEAPDEVDQALLEVAAGFSEGSLGRAVSMLKTGMLEARRELIESLLFLDPRSPIDWLDRAQKLSDPSSEFEEKLEVLTVFFRDLMLFKQGNSKRLVNTDLLDLIESTAPRFSMEAVLTTLDAFLSVQHRRRGNISAQLLAEELVDRLRNPQTRAFLSPL